MFYRTSPTTLVSASAVRPREQSRALRIIAEKGSGGFSAVDRTSAIPRLKTTDSLRHGTGAEVTQTRSQRAPASAVSEHERKQKSGGVRSRRSAAVCVDVSTSDEEVWQEAVEERDDSPFKGDLFFPAESVLDIVTRPSAADVTSQSSRYSSAEDGLLTDAASAQKSGGVRPGVLSGVRSGALMEDDDDDDDLQQTTAASYLRTHSAPNYTPEAEEDTQKNLDVLRRQMAAVRSQREVDRKSLLMRSTKSLNMPRVDLSPSSVCGERAAIASRSPGATQSDRRRLAAAAAAASSDLGRHRGASAWDSAGGAAVPVRHTAARTRALYPADGARRPSSAQLKGKSRYGE